MPALSQNTTAAHVAPLAVFMALNFVPGFFRIENPELPWYIQAPEHWLYPLQTMLCGILLFAFRRHYRLSPWRGWLLAPALAVTGFAVWIMPSWWHDRLITNGHTVPHWLEWFGVVKRTDGFDPTLFAGSPSWQAAVVGLRFLRLVIIVPLVEEIFWRGFLMRYLVADGRHWTTVSFGTHRWHVFWTVTFLVMLAHHPGDYAAAFAWAGLVYFVAVRTRSLGACVLMHALCNLLLGLYVLKTEKWGFW